QRRGVECGEAAVCGGIDAGPLRRREDGAHGHHGSTTLTWRGQRRLKRGRGRAPRAPSRAAPPQPAVNGRLSPSGCVAMCSRWKACATPSRHPSPTPRPVTTPRAAGEFVGLDLEELQTVTGRYRVGSHAFARARRARGDALAGALILEMVGYRDPTPGAQIVPPLLGIDVPRTGDFLAAVGDA